MKRLLAIAVLLCLLLCGCKAVEPIEVEEVVSPVQPQQQFDEESAAQQSVPTPTPVQEETPQTVTIYLLTESALYDSGCTKYDYDDNYNIDAYTTYNIENDPMFTAFFEDKDEHGMARRYRLQWAEGGEETRTLTYFDDGKLKEEQYDDSNYSGYQYEYDQKGDVTEKREYYEGVLESVVYYEYDGELLQAVYCEDKLGNLIFDCRVENGLITEKICYEEDSNYSYQYAYDQNRNLVQMTILAEGETIPCEVYSYQAVEVESERAWYLLQQQKYLLPII